MDHSGSVRRTRPVARSRVAPRPRAPAARPGGVAARGGRERRGGAAQGRRALRHGWPRGRVRLLLTGQL